MPTSTKPISAPGSAGTAIASTSPTAAVVEPMRITVTGLVRDRSSPQLEAVDLLTSDSSTASADPANVHPFHKLRLDPGDTAIVVVRWRLDCGAGSDPEVYSDSISLRFRYLSTFTRTQSVRLPFAVTLRCRG